jgi:hypothetical protein
VTRSADSSNFRFDFGFGERLANLCQTIGSSE